MAELMIKSSTFTATYAHCLVAATPDHALVQPEKGKAPKGMTPDEAANVEREMESLEQNFLAIERSHGAQVLNLVLAIRFLSTLLANAGVARFLSSKHPAMYAEFRGLVASTSLDRE